MAAQGQDGTPPHPSRSHLLQHCSIRFSTLISARPACPLGSQRIVPSMDLFESAQHFWMWQMLLLVAVILAFLAIVNYAAARTAEWQNPPKGSFIEVDGVRLHYSDRGTGRPIVMIHGNLVTGDDYNTSGVAERLLGTCRVILFDRPGYGYSGRPRWRPWGPVGQAELLHKALRELGVERPVLVGHSWGSLVALAYAIRHRSDTAGLVLLSGYYFPTFRLDALMVAPGAVLYWVMFCATPSRPSSAG